MNFQDAGKMRWNSDGDLSLHIGDVQYIIKVRDALDLLKGKSVDIYFPSGEIRHLIPFGIADRSFSRRTYFFHLNGTPYSCPSSAVERVIERRSFSAPIQVKMQEATA